MHAFVSEYFWAFARRAHSAYTWKNPWKFIRARRLLSNTKNTEEDSWRQEREREKEEEDDVRRAGERCTRGAPCKGFSFQNPLSESQPFMTVCVCVCVCVFQIDVCCVRLPSRPPVWPKRHMSHIMWRIEVQDIEPMHVWRPHEIKMDPTCAVGLTERFVSACYSKLLFCVFNL